MKWTEKPCQSFPSKTHKQIMLLINICFRDIAGCNLSRFFHFYVKKLNEIKQEIRKSTYFVFHSHKIQKVISTFFIPCFVGAVRLCGNSCTPSIITARRDVASGDTVSVAIHKWWVYRASSALQHYYHCWTCLRHSIIPNIPTSAWIWHWPSHRKLAGIFRQFFLEFPIMDPMDCNW